MRKVVITGPESSGKSSLAEALADYYSTVTVPEYARTYLEKLGRPYEEKDLLDIALGQLEWEEKYASTAKDWLFLDTSLLVLKIWSEHKYGRCDSFILENLQRSTYDLYLLCRPDIPWTYDPLRENPTDRDELYTLYQNELESLGFPYAVISGQGEDRVGKALAVLEGL